MTRTSKTSTPTSPPVRVLLLGYGPLGLALLRGLLDTPQCEVVGVFRWSHHPKGKGYTDEFERQFARRIKENGLAEIRCAGANSYGFAEQLEKLKPHLVLIGSWGEILKPHVLKYPGVLVVNCHPSKLPAHRGANPYVSAIRAGETESGLTFHLVEEKIDTGPILLQESVPIEPEDTGAELRDRCSEVATRMVPQLIELVTPAIHKGKKLKPLKQDETLGSYFPALKLEDGLIHWNREPEDILNQIRGLHPWLDCFTFLEGRLLVAVSRAELRYRHPPARSQAPGTIVSYEDGRVWAATADPETLLGFSRFKLGLPYVFLPNTPSQWMGHLLFRPGYGFRYRGQHA